MQIRAARLGRLLSAVGVAIALMNGCGSKGPLYLPEPRAQHEPTGTNTTGSGDLPAPVAAQAQPPKEKE